MCAAIDREPALSAAPGIGAGTVREPVQPPPNSSAFRSTPRNMAAGRSGASGKPSRRPIPTISSEQNQPAIGGNVARRHFKEAHHVH
jgi:hypothetical protein